VITYTKEIYSGTVTTSSNSHSTPVNTKWEKECQLLLNITAVSGTNPTLDLTIEVYNTLRDTWHTLATFSTVSATGVDVGYVEYGLGEKIALSWVVGGTNTPTFTFTLDAVFKNA